MADQSIRAERNPHAIPGQIISCDLLIQFQLYFGNDMSIVADTVCTGAGIIP